MIKQTKINSAEEFLHIYNEIDAFMRKSLQLGDEAEHTFMIQEMAKKGFRAFSDFGYELRLFARLRNAIVHNPYLRTANPIAEPHPDTVKKYKYILDLSINPPKALSIAIPGQKIFKATLKSNVQEILKTMLQHTYTHVPIIENDKMVGVFSENTVFCYIAKNKGCIITSDFTVQEFADFIPLDQHQSEYFEFIPRDSLLQDVENIFKTGLQKIKRISVVYITEHGKPEEKLLGMLTAWDLAGK